MIQRCMVRLSPSYVNKCFLDACKGYYCIQDAWINGVDIERDRNNLIEMNLPIASIMAGKFYHRINFCCEYDDVMQSASMGLIEAVGSYHPREDLSGSFGAYSRFKIFKFMVLEWEESHWRTMKPSRAEGRNWMSGNVSNDEEANRYYEKYLLSIDSGEFINES